MAYREQVFHELCIECRALAPHVCSSCGRALCDRHHRPSGCSSCRPPKRPRVKKPPAKAVAADSRVARQTVTDALVLGPPLLLAAAVALFALAGLLMPIYAIIRS